MSIEAGYRFSDYSTGFSTDTYKAGLDWAPVDQVRFRGSYQRAVRAPNVGELFSSQSVALDGSIDPCTGTPGDPPEATQAECLLTGMTAAQYLAFSPPNPAGQYNGLLGGNPNLTPETSDTISFGVVIRRKSATCPLPSTTSTSRSKTRSAARGRQRGHYIQVAIDTARRSSAI